MNLLRTHQSRWHSWKSLGGGFDGGNSKKLLDAVDELATKLPITCAPIIESMRAVRNAVQGLEKKPSLLRYSQSDIEKNLILLSSLTETRVHTTKCKLAFSFQDLVHQVNVAFYLKGMISFFLHTFLRNLVAHLSAIPLMAFPALRMFL